MRYLWLLALVCLAGCSAQKNNTVENEPQNTEKMKDYIDWTKIPKGKSWIDQKVVFEGKISTMPHQHMMKGSFDGEEQNIYIDPTEQYNYSQIVGYYRELSLKMDNTAKNALDKGSKAIFRFYGTIGEVSGAGKGGGTHSEYYIDLEKMEVIK